MTERIKRNVPILNAIHKCSPLERKQMIKIARPELIHAICDCVLNVAHSKVPISNYQKRKLRKKVNVLQQLSQPKHSAQKKKKLLLQHGEGILTSIIGPIIKAITDI